MNARRIWVAAIAAGVCVTMTVQASRAADNGVIKGVCKLKGDRPKAKTIDMKANADCVKMHGDKAVEAQALKVFPDGTLPYVFVYVKSGIKGKYDPPKEPITIDQNGCMYKPHVQGMVAGQPMKIVNSDPTAHNIHAMPKKNEPFNFGQPKQGMVAPRAGSDTFTKSEIMVQVKCDVHPWMSAYIGVVDHPFFATTGKGGTFEIKNLPDGEYELEAWHEKWGKATQKVTVKDGKAGDVTFEFSSEKADAGPVGRTVLASTLGGEPDGCCGGKATK